METGDEAFKTLLGTVEFIGSRLAATELVTRALWVTYPNPQAALTYLERHLGQTLAQPQLLDRPDLRDAMKQYVEGLIRPAPTELPE